MMVLGIGRDLVELDRFRLLYGDFDPDVLDRCFTAGE
jgi:phosphopantetheinyl transferase (holo-ACP synthase)